MQSDRRARFSRKSSVCAPHIIGVRSASSRLRPSRRQLICSPFYESDCQGHTSASLIAGRCLSRQSAPTAEGTRPAGASGLARQSACASFAPFALPIRLDVCKHAVARARAANHGSISDSAVWAGLTLVRVLRGGLELGECLGGLRGRANELLETAPRTRVPDPGALGGRTLPHRRPGESGR